LGPLFSVVDFGLKDYRIAGYFRGVFIFVYFHGQTEIAKINSAKYYNLFWLEIIKDAHLGRSN
jgi:hypothetical protein